MTPRRSCPCSARPTRTVAGWRETGPSFWSTSRAGHDAADGPYQPRNPAQSSLWAGFRQFMALRCVRMLLLAEGVGFEPTEVSLVRFQGACTRPLCEPSMASAPGREQQPVRIIQHPCSRVQAGAAPPVGALPRRQAAFEHPRAAGHLTGAPWVAGQVWTSGGAPAPDGPVPSAAGRRRRPRLSSTRCRRSRCRGAHPPGAGGLEPPPPRRRCAGPPGPRRCGGSRHWP